VQRTHASAATPPAAGSGQASPTRLDATRVADSQGIREVAEASWVGQRGANADARSGVVSLGILRSDYWRAVLDVLARIVAGPTSNRVTARWHVATVVVGSGGTLDID